MRSVFQENGQQLVVYFALIAAALVALYIVPRISRHPLHHTQVANSTRTSAGNHLIVAPNPGRLEFAAVRPQVPAQSFPDVPHGHWAAPAIAGLLRRHILQVADRRRFEGEKPVTRYELAVALYRMVCYLEPTRHPASAPPHRPAEWLVENSYLSADTLVVQPPTSTPVSPALLSESLAYVSDRVLLHRAPPGELNGSQ